MNILLLPQKKKDEKSCWNRYIEREREREKLYLKKSLLCWNIHFHIIGFPFDVIVTIKKLKEKAEVKNLL